MVVGGRLLSREHCNRTKFAAREAASGIIRRSEAVVVGVRARHNQVVLQVRGVRGILVVARLG